MAIPKVLKWFFEIESMQPKSRKEINILYEGVRYNAYFVCDTYNRIRLFWDKRLAVILSAFEGLSPIPLVRCTRITDQLFIFDMLVGSDRQNNIRHKEWMIQCDPKIYDCYRAFDKLITVNWHQDSQMSKVEVNDSIFIYSASPIESITHQCIVNKVNISNLEIDDSEYYNDLKALDKKGPFLELQCVRQFDELEGLRMVELKNYGIEGNFSGIVKVSDALRRHLYKMVKEQNGIDRITGSNMKYVAAMEGRDIFGVEDECTATMLPDYALFQIAKKKECKSVITKTVTVMQKQRNPYIAEYAKRCAAGNCQLCGNPAPFKDASGKPYLESHHIVWLANGGEDSIENTVALCPNCHRKMHIVNDPNDIAYLKKNNKT